MTSTRASRSTRERSITPCSAAAVVGAAALVLMLLAAPAASATENPPAPIVVVPAETGDGVGESSGAGATTVPTAPATTAPTVGPTVGPTAEPSPAPSATTAPSPSSPPVSEPIDRDVARLLRCLPDETPAVTASGAVRYSATATEIVVTLPPLARGVDCLDEVGVRIWSLGAPTPEHEEGVLKRLAVVPVPAHGFAGSSFRFVAPADSYGVFVTSYGRLGAAESTRVYLSRGETVVVGGAGSAGTASSGTGTTVVVSDRTASGRTALAATGVDPAPIAVGAAWLLLGGIVLVAFRRRSDARV